MNIYYFIAEVQLQKTKKKHTNIAFEKIHRIFTVAGMPLLVSQQETQLFG